MNKEKPLKKEKGNWKITCSTIICRIIWFIFTILLFITGCCIIWQYSNLLFGNTPTYLQKMSFDYSITIFTGCAMFVLIYSYKSKELVNKLFNLKDIEGVDGYKTHYKTKK